MSTLRENDLLIQEMKEMLEASARTRQEFYDRHKSHKESKNNRKFALDSKPKNCLTMDEYREFFKR